MSASEERQHYQNWFELAPDACLITDVKGTIEVANGAAAALLNVRRNSLVGKSLLSFVAESDRPALSAQLDNLTHSNQPASKRSPQRSRSQILLQDWELSLQPQKQAAFPVSLSLTGERVGAASRNETRQGQVACLYWLFRDLSDRKQAELALRETQQQLQAILDNSPAVIYAIDRQNQHLFVNRSYAEIMSVTPEAPIGKSIYEFWPAETANNFAANNQQVIQDNRPVKVEEVVPQPDGLHTYITLKFPLRDVDGNPYAVCGISTDITDRKQTEQKIREQAALLDITSDAIFVRDLDNRIIYWNRGAERLYGWSAEEAIGQFADLLLQDPTSTIAVILQRLTETGEWQGEIHNITKSGEAVTVAVRWTLMRDVAGQPQAILTVDTDITEKKSLEAQFHQAQRMESLGTLASGIAHDLNNVLTPIVSISQLLRLRQPTLDRQSQEMLKVLEESAKRGASIIKQILTFTRGTGGERQPVQIAPILQEVIDVTQQTFPKSISIHASTLDPELQLISVDPTYLHQVLMNLCVNARDAMPNGGAIALSAENFHVDALFAQMHLEARVGNYVLITVADTGSGIPPEVRDRIFEPFFTTKALGQGTGLGLASVLGIVKAYGGFIEVQSQPGTGSQFKIYLPALVEMEAIPYEALTELPRGRGESILIVDDENAILQSAQVILEAYNYRVITASRGADAIEIYRDRQDEIHAVLMDMMMPEMDGINAIQALQAINPHVKIVATSGLAGNYRPTLQTLGIAIVLTKPFNTIELLHSISQH
ncbi:PAS domain-containing sensor histidine kinase [Pseudanabaena sp. PCC 6802]|uniref:hybrid sensor histidine kinase/response regulator n=1 Tax=Pseudanabaena sp. PCC 6802 TaxID=118173 RepID=UPI000348E5EC|nr:PAS domain-containing sensor histidine kinase [Pseudanabaena sp. PCC 6802]